MFIPSIVVLIIGAVICFFVLPKMSPYVLGILCMVMFGLGVWQHYSMFPYEYRTSMVTDMLQQYAGFIMILAVIFAGLLAMGLLPSSNSAGNNASSIIPEMKMPNVFSGNSSKNSSKSMFNLSGNSAGNAVTNISKTVTDFINQTNQGKSNSLVSPSFKVS